MSLNLPPETLYNFMVGDFEDAWNSLAWNPSARSRGNFMFARQATSILEFISRLCWSDTTGSAISDLSNELLNIEPKYFTKLPGFCTDFDFNLPYAKSRGCELLWGIFDLVRNGQAHQYQQIVVELSDQKQWAISLTGAELGRHLDKVRAEARPCQFLGYSITSNQVIWLKVFPDILFLDLTKAIENSKMFSKDLSFDYLSRPRAKSRRSKTKLKGKGYNFNLRDLEKALIDGHHTRL